MGRGYGDFEGRQPFSIVTVKGGYSKIAKDSLRVGHQEISTLLKIR